MVTMRMTMFAICALAAAVPAAAQTASATTTTAAQPRPTDSRPVRSTSVPEPADFALFATGVVGLLLGRRVSRSRRKSASDD